VVINNLQCTDEDNRSYRNICNMSFISFSLAVIFIIRLFSTSDFRVPKLVINLAVVSKALRFSRAWHWHVQMASPKELLKWLTPVHLTPLSGHIWKLVKIHSVYSLFLQRIAAAANAKCRTTTNVFGNAELSFKEKSCPNKLLGVKYLGEQQTCYDETCVQ